MPARPLDCYVVTTPGLEAVTAGELRRLGFKVPNVGHGGMSVNMSQSELYLTNLQLSTASRVLVRIGSGDAEYETQLHGLARSMPWDRWLVAGQPLRVVVSSSTSRLHHTGLVEELVRDALGNVGGGPTVQVRMHRDRVTFSVDSSGDHLHRRGWRLQTAKAPLRETLAAALLMLADWDADRPLVDPMCGSGTIAIEAALRAAGIPAGSGRTFAFEQFPTFDRDRFEAVRQKAQRPARDVEIRASDRDAGAIAAATANAERAGVADRIGFTVAPIGRTPLAAGPGLLATNPPYGERVGGKDLRDLYDSINLVAGDWKRAVIAADETLALRAAPGAAEAASVSNGGIRVGLYVS